MCERAHCPTVSVSASARVGRSSSPVFARVFPSSGHGLTDMAPDLQRKKKRCFVSPGAGAKTDRHIRNFDCTWQGYLELGVGDVVAVQGGIGGTRPSTFADPWLATRLPLAVDSGGRAKRS